MMRRGSFVILATATLAISACDGIAKSPIDPAPNAAFRAAAPASSRQGQRLFVAFKAKPTGWIGEYSTGSSPALLVQMTKNFDDPYAIYADAKGVLYAAQTGFNEYDTATGDYLRTAKGGRPTPAPPPVVAPNGTIYWGIYNLPPQGQIYGILPKHTESTLSRRSQGPVGIVLSPDHHVWVDAIGTSGTNEYDASLRWIRRVKASHVVAFDENDAYALDGASNTVVVFDATTFKPTRELDVAKYPVNVAFDGAHNAYVTSVFLYDTGGVLAEYKAGTSHLVRKISLGTGIPFKSAVDANGYVYVANTFDEEVDIYPPGSGKVSGKISNGDIPRLVTLSPPAN
jgi:YVTN family beta-propeller protein